MQRRELPISPLGRLHHHRAGECNTTKRRSWVVVVVVAVSFIKTIVIRQRDEYQRRVSDDVRRSELVLRRRY